MLQELNKKVLNFPENIYYFQSNENAICECIKIHKLIRKENKRRRKEKRELNYYFLLPFFIFFFQFNKFNYTGLEKGRSYSTIHIFIYLLTIYDCGECVHVFILQLSVRRFAYLLWYMLNGWFNRIEHEELRQTGQYWL